MKVTLNTLEGKGKEINQHTGHPAGAGANLGQNICPPSLQPSTSVIGGKGIGSCPLPAANSAHRLSTGALPAAGPYPQSPLVP
jgi:hypothetical protein